MKHKYPDTLEDLYLDIAKDGTKIFWCDEQLLDSGFLNAQDDFASPVLKASQVLLKKARQRFIFLHSDKTKSLVFKLFPLHSISSKLRHPKYAYREFTNMRQAKSLSLPVPEAIAFIEKRRNGLVVCTGLIQENITESTDLKKMQKEGQDFNTITQLATDILKQAFDAGANHIDLRDENIMLQLSSKKLFIIDWQYASFVSARAPWLLEYLAAYFINHSPESKKTRLINEWLPKLHDDCKHPLTLKRFLIRVNALIKKKLRVRRRLALKPIKDL